MTRPTVERKEPTVADTLESLAHRLFHALVGDPLKEGKYGDCYYFVSVPDKKKQIEMCTLRFVIHENGGFFSRDVRASDLVKCSHYEENTAASLAPFDPHGSCRAENHTGLTDKTDDHPAGFIPRKCRLLLHHLAVLVCAVAATRGAAFLSNPMVVVVVTISGFAIGIMALTMTPFLTAVPLLAIES